MIHKQLESLNRTSNRYSMAVIDNSIDIVLFSNSHLSGIFVTPGTDSTPYTIYRYLTSITNHQDIAQLTSNSSEWGCTHGPTPTCSWGAPLKMTPIRPDPYPYPVPVP